MIRITIDFDNASLEENYTNPQWEAGDTLRRLAAKLDLAWRNINSWTIRKRKFNVDDSSGFRVGTMTVDREPPVNTKSTD